MIVLSSTQARQILDALQSANEVEVSLDLGLSQQTVRTDGPVAIMPDGQRVMREELEQIVGGPEVLYRVEDSHAWKLSRFDEKTGRFYKLRPTESWPALEISGVTMHRLVGGGPQPDVAAKLELLTPIRGRVLDTCCGLGYTAIGAARTAERVTTVEADQNVLALAALNPHSRALFDNSRIELLRGDVSELIERFDDGAFNVIIHDPPTIALAGELYSDRFYGELHRVLRAGGKLLHYTGAPGSKKRNVDLPSRVAQRLKASGFSSARKDEATACVVAVRR